MSEYWKLLQDPRWQKMRLEVLDREKFTCQECGATDKTLHVHHTFYAKGRKPWEYEPSDLRCLCADCHKATGEELEVLHRLVGALDEAQRVMARGYLRGILAIAERDDVSIPAGDFVESMGVAAAYGVLVSDVEDEAFGGVIMSSKALIAVGRKRRAQIQVAEAIEALDQATDG